MRRLGGVLALVVVLLGGRAEAGSDGIVMTTCFDLLNACRTLNQLSAGNLSGEAMELAHGRREVAGLHGRVPRFEELGVAAREQVHLRRRSQEPAHRLLEGAAGGYVQAHDAEHRVRVLAVLEGGTAHRRNSPEWAGVHVPDTVAALQHRTRSCRGAGFGTPWITRRSVSK
jgi:hypothetical protein